MSEENRGLGEENQTFGETEVIENEQVPTVEAAPDMSTSVDIPIDVPGEVSSSTTTVSGISVPSEIRVTLQDDRAEEVMTLDEDYGIQVTAVNPITSASGLKGVLLDVLGDYDAIVVEYRYQNSSSSSYQYVREIQPDYPWLCSAGIFLALLWSVFTIGGRLICRK